MGRRHKPVPDTKRRSRTFGKAPVGRPAGFREEMIAQVIELVSKLNYTDAQVAAFLDKDPATLWRWKQKIPEFGRAFIRGKQKQQEVLEAAMFARGTGYSHEAVKIFPPTKVVSGRGKTRKVSMSKPIVVKFTEHFPPDPRAAELLLQKLDPTGYSRRTTLVGDPTQPVQFIMQNRPAKENP